MTGTVRGRNGFAAMARRLLLLALVLTSCSSGKQADLPAIAEARSLGAEWALVNEEASKGHLTSTYLETMRLSLREQLKTAAGSLAYPHTAYGEEIAALLKEPDDATPASLRAHVGRLQSQEDALESA
jgi:hypothetical protein